MLATQAPSFDFQSIMTPAIFGLSGLVLSADERAFFHEADPAGYIIFGRNVENREQLRALTDSLREIHGRERLLITMDEIYNFLVTMDYPDAITNGLRRQTDLVRGIIERTRSDLTLSMREQHLQDALQKFSDKFADKFD